MFSYGGLGWGYPGGGCCSPTWGPGFGGSSSSIILVIFILLVIVLCCCPKFVKC